MASDTAILEDKLLIVVNVPDYILSGISPSTSQIIVCTAVKHVDETTKRRVLCAKPPFCAVWFSNQAETRFTTAFELSFLPEECIGLDVSLKSGREEGASLVPDRLFWFFYKANHCIERNNKIARYVMHRAIL